MVGLWVDAAKSLKITGTRMSDRTLEHHKCDTEKDL